MRSMFADREPDVAAVGAEPERASGEPAGRAGAVLRLPIFWPLLAPE